LITDNCDNCGSNSHNFKNCIERPRKRKARFNIKNIFSDEYLQIKNNISWDIKRDRWSNFEVDKYQIEIKKWKFIDSLSNQKKKKELKKQIIKLI